MTFSEFPILADENIHEEVILFLRQTGFNVAPVSGTKLAGLSDLVLLDYAFKEKRIIVTQDSDFARFIFTLNISFVGIVHLRPGHFNPAFHIATITSIIKANLELTPPFILIAENNQKDVRIRLRQM